MKVLYFTAEWCAPCKMLGPVMDKLTPKLNITVEKVDVDNDPDSLAMKYGVMSVPTLVMVDGNKEINRSVGYAGEQSVKDFLVKGVSQEQENQN